MEDGIMGGMGFDEEVWKKAMGLTLEEKERILNEVKRGMDDTRIWAEKSENFELIGRLIKQNHPAITGVMAKASMANPMLLMLTDVLYGVIATSFAIGVYAVKHDIPPSAMEAFKERF